MFTLNMHFKTSPTQVDIAPGTEEARIVAFVYKLVAIPADVPDTHNLSTRQCRSLRGDLIRVCTSPRNLITLSESDRY